MHLNKTINKKLLIDRPVSTFDCWVIYIQYIYTVGQARHMYSHKRNRQKKKQRFLRGFDDFEQQFFWYNSLKVLGVHDCPDFKPWGNF